VAGDVAGADCVGGGVNSNRCTLMAKKPASNGTAITANTRDRRRALWE
jgi:hypothetical protein